ncbi:MAG: hypothetical protein AAB263_15105 [Planctomycetota bacterium]
MTASLVAAVIARSQAPGWHLAMPERNRNRISASTDLDLAL